MKPIRIPLMTSYSLKQMLRGAAVALLAAGTCMASSAQSLLDDVRPVMQALHKDGYLSSGMEIVGHTDDRYNASAAWRLKDGSCKVEVRHAPIPTMARYQGHAKWQRFLALHELAHCQLFADPADYGAKGLGLDATGTKLLADVMGLDGLAPRNDEYEESRTMLLSWYHEAYADAMAILQLRLENPSGEGLEFIATLRSGFTMSPSHETDREIAALMSMPMAQIPVSLEGRKELSRRVALLETVRHVMGPSLKSGDASGFSVLLGERLKGGMQSALSAKVKGKLAFSPFFIGDVADASVQLPGYPVLQWVVQASFSGTSEQGWKAWLAQRYGLSDDDFIAAAGAASRHLESLALKDDARFLDSVATEPAKSLN